MGVVENYAITTVFLTFLLRKCPTSRAVLFHNDGNKLFSAELVTGLGALSETSSGGELVWRIS